MKAFHGPIPWFAGIAVMLLVVMGVVSLSHELKPLFVASDQSLASSFARTIWAAIQSALEHKLVKERLRDLVTLRTRLGPDSINSPKQNSTGLPPS